MEKVITINKDSVRLYVLEVFGVLTNEQIIAVDITDLYYKKDSILELLKLLKKDHPTLKPVFYRVSADNYNNVYICIVGGKTEDHSVKEINASVSDYEKYGSAIAGLHSKY